MVEKLGCISLDLAGLPSCVWTPGGQLFLEITSPFGYRHSVPPSHFARILWHAQHKSLNSHGMAAIENIGFHQAPRQYYAMCCSRLFPFQHCDGRGGSSEGHVAVWIEVLCFRDHLTCVLCGLDSPCMVSAQWILTFIKWKSHSITLLS